MGSQNRDQPQWFFWVMWGPLTLFFPFLLLIYQKFFSYFSLLLIAPFGLFFSWQRGKKGFYLSALALVLLSFFALFSLSFEERCWGGGIVLAMTLSFFITALSSEEVDESVRSLQRESQNRLHHLVRLDEKLQSIEKNWRKQGEGESDDQRKQIVLLEEQLARAVKAVGARKGAEEIERKLRKMEGLYQQLREQFVEKSRLLIEARRELFLHQEQKLLSEKEWGEKEKLLWYEWERGHIHSFERWEEESGKIQSAYETEIDALHDLISHLVSVFEGNPPSNASSDPGS